jgi:hypothetical protein
LLSKLKRGRNEKKIRSQYILGDSLKSTKIVLKWSYGALLRKVKNILMMTKENLDESCSFQKAMYVHQFFKESPKIYCDLIFFSFRPLFNLLSKL